MYLNGFQEILTCITFSFTCTCSICMTMCLFIYVERRHNEVFGNIFYLCSMIVFLPQNNHRSRLWRPPARRLFPSLDGCRPSMLKKFTQKFVTFMNNSCQYVVHVNISPPWHIFHVYVQCFGFSRHFFDIDEFSFIIFPFWLCRLVCHKTSSNNLRSDVHPF